MQKPTIALKGVDSSLVAQGIENGAFNTVVTALVHLNAASPVMFTTHAHGIILSDREKRDPLMHIIRTHNAVKIIYDEEPDIVVPLTQRDEKPLWRDDNTLVPPTHAALHLGHMLHTIASSVHDSAHKTVMEAYSHYLTTHTHPATPAPMPRMA